MIITWFNIYNKATFLAEDLVSKEISVELGDLGPKDILLTSGNTVGITYEGRFISLERNDKNPFSFGDLITYLDDDDEIWLGVFSES